MKNLHKWVTVCCLLTVALFFTPGKAFATDPVTAGFPGNAATFEVDGDFRSGQFPLAASGLVVTGTDWITGSAGGSGVLLTNSAGVAIPGFNSATNATWFVDGHYTGGDDITTFGNNASNSDLIGSTSTAWDVVDGSGPGKDDITNAFVHRQVDGSTGDLWFIIAFERIDVTGNTYVDFEYNQAGVFLTGTTPNFIRGNGPTGGRTVGDITVEGAFVNGGSQPLPRIRLWQSNSTWSDSLPISPGSELVAVNLINILGVAPGASYTGTGASSSATTGYQFIEIAINLDALGILPANLCSEAATVLIKSRASQSFTSNLHDFAGPIAFPLAPPPGASATGGQLTCTTTSVVLSATTSTGTGFSWAGPGIVSGQTSSNPRVSSTGTFTVTVTNSATGCSSTATALVNENRTAPGASATGGTLTCTTTSVVLSAATTSGTGFSWAGPGIVSGGTTANPRVSSTGTYTVTVTNSVNGCTSTATALVNNNITPPGASATGGTLTCAITSVVLSAATTSGTGFSWAGPGIVSGGTTANPRVSSAGTYTVTVTSSANGCTSSATALVNNDGSTPGASATGGQLTCTTTSVVLSASTTSGTGFSWAGPGIVSGGTTANPRVSSTGTYTVTVTNSANGCTSTATALVNENRTPPGASATGGQLTCTTTSVVISASTTTGTGFSWAGPGIVSGGTTANPRVSSTGTYTVTVTNSANGCTSTATALVNENRTPPGASATGGTLNCTTTSAVLSAATTSGTGFVWSGPCIASGGNTANPTVTCAGTYTVTVTNSANGCTSTATALVNQTVTPPGASATGGTLTCTTTSVVLSAATTSGTGFSWAGPGIVSGGTTANPRVSSSGTYTVTVTNSANGCTSTATALVNTNFTTPFCRLRAPDPEPPCGSTGNVLCVDSVANANTYLWSVTGTGWSLNSPADSICARYTAGTGDGVFKLVLTNTASGCKDSCTVTFSCTTSDLFCSLTQGAYGNANGRFCGGLRRLALIGQLLDGTPLVLGNVGAGRSLTIVRADSQCVIDRMPAGGPSDILPLANYTFTALCGFSPATPSFPLKNGRFRNNMLGQTLALGLNLRLNEANLGTVVLSGGFMLTSASTGCDESATPIPGTQNAYPISSVVVSELISRYGTATVANLFALANRALAGLETGSATLNQIHGTVGAINEGFDECRFLDGFSTSAPSAAKLIVIELGNEIPTDYALSVNYPNPFNPSTTIEYALPEPSKVTLKVYNVLGQEVATLVNEALSAGYQSVTWNATTNSGFTLASGMYIYRLQAVSTTSGREFTKVRKMVLLK